MIHKYASNWTEDSIFCYRRGCNCRGCYSDINESYRDCKPKEYQCNFYVTYLEQENKENIHYLACMTEQRNKLKSALEEIKSIVDKFDYWSSNLSEASDLISEVKDKINEVLND